MNFINYLKLARLDKPLAILLLFVPCLLGLILAYKINITYVNYSYYLTLFLLGSILMRSAGCVINDIVDHKFDTKVSRTKTRMIASAKISKKSAILFTILLLLPSLIILLQLNLKAIIIGFIASLLVIIYPFTKRITNYPQIFLGFTFNIGCLIAFVTITNKIYTEIILLYLGLIIWTVIYDTIYAFQDIEDDLKVGIKSTTIIFKDNPKRILKILNFCIFLIFIFIGYSLSFQFEYYLVILVADLYLNNLISNCDFSSPKSCLRTFKNNIYFILLIAISFILG